MTVRYSRRHVIGLIGGGVALAATPWSVSASLRKLSWLTGGRDAAGGYGLYQIDQAGRATLVHSTHLRLHAPMRRPNTSQIVAVARSVGDKIYFGDAKVVNDVSSSQGRHFYGHGAFSSGGDVLFVGENDFEQARGLISVRDPNLGYQAVDEFPSGGLAPHEVIRQGNLLIVANGGLETHPETGRQVLNLHSMASNLVIIDPKTGELIDSYSLGDEHQYLSLRHVAAASGQIYVGAQDQARDNPDRPLLFRVDLIKNEKPRPMATPEGGWPQFRGYIGSVAVDSGSNYVAATSPRGGVITIWPIAGNGPVKTIGLADVCGVSATGQSNQFMVTTGEGAILTLNMGQPEITQKRLSSKDIAWDNHLTAVGL